MKRYRETVAWIGVVCCAGWMMFPSVNEAGALRKEEVDRAMSVYARAEDPQTMRSSQTSTPDESSAEIHPAASTPEKPRASNENPGERRFEIISYQVEGNTILEQPKIESILDPYKGSGRRLSDIENARSELEKAYHAAGYPTVVVMLPEQTIEEGVVKFQVLEGRLVHITVTGNEHYSWVNIRGKLPSLQPGALIYEPTFVKELGTANGNPDLKIAPVLKMGEEPGTVDLELKVKDRLPVHGKIEADNRGPITTPQDRLVAEIQHTNLFGGDEILTVNTVQTPTDWGAIQNYGASFVYPVKWPDHLLAVYGSYSRSNSVLAGSAISLGGGTDVGIAGNATVGGFRYIFPLFAGQKNTHQLSIGVDYKHLEPSKATFPDGGQAVVKSPVQYTPASVSYSGFYPDDWGLTKLSLSARGYVAGLIPGGSEVDFGGTCSQPNADPINCEPGNRVGSTGTFAVIQGGLDRVQPLPGEFDLALHTDGQWGSQPLIPAEEYFAGGFDTVRGYKQYEAIGDNAVRVRAELTTPQLFAIPVDRFWQRRRSSDYTLRVKVAGFYDYANVWVQQAQPGETSQFTLEGVGGGIKVKFPKDIGQLLLYQGFALRTTPNTKKGDTFVHFSVGLMF